VSAVITLTKRTGVLHSRIGIVAADILMVCGKVVEVARLLQKTRLVFAMSAFERKILFAVLLDVVIHSVLLFGHFVAMRADKVTCGISNVLRSRHAGARQ
jgi:hypothetical protein